MEDATERLLYAFDGHDVAGVRAALQDGADACNPIRGKLPVQWLLEQYARSSDLIVCLQLLFDSGAELPEPLLRPVVMNDAASMRAAIKANPSVIHHRATLVSTFASMDGVSLLHVAAEYGHLDVARVLVEAGADVNATADFDSDGFNGHTPIFHTVNSAFNRSEPIMRLLLDAGARTDVLLKGLVWGKGFEWETTFFDVTPISFAQMGLMPQVHRREHDIYANINTLLKSAGRGVPSLKNVPNRYLQPKTG